MNRQTPSSVTIDGIAYVREDTLATQSVPSSGLERSYTLRELEGVTGIGYHALYRAVKRGDLKAACPNGSSRGMRVWASDFRAWKESMTYTPSRSRTSSRSSARR